MKGKGSMPTYWLSSIAREGEGFDVDEKVRTPVATPVGAFVGASVEQLRSASTVKTPSDTIYSPLSKFSAPIESTGLSTFKQPAAEQHHLPLISSEGFAASDALPLNNDVQSRDIHAVNMTNSLSREILPL